MRKFIRTRTPGAAPAPHKTNGVSNGAGPRRDDHSTLTRYWSESDECGETDKGAPGLGLPAGLVLPGLGLGPDLPLWEDPEFPAAPSSLADRRLAHRTHWLRPHEICSRPRFLGDTAVDAELRTEEMEPEGDEQFAARWSVSAGEAGDAHVCCAAAALALTPRLLARVAPPQSFRTRYTGIFRFRFWVFGAWREVAVDDRLPARGGRLLTSRAALPDDFTLPLLEKAYAKLHGSYAALRAGSVARALQELSGGVLQSFAPPRQPRALLLQVLHSAVPRSTLLVASAAPAPEKDGSGRRLRNGLIPGQAYCVTGLARVREPTGDDAEHSGALVRVRAPSGRGEWAGAWARGGPQWRALAEPDRELLARRAAEPGHFWMTFSDFARSFARLELVHVGPDDWLSEPALHGKRPWRAVLARRRWRCGYNAGGPPRCRATAHTNPQFHVQVPRSDAGKCHVVVSVTQQYSVGAGRRERLHGIGFAVYELPPGAAPRRAALAAAALPDLRALDVTHESRAREVVTFFTLPAGQYLVMPHTHRPHVEAAFLLRILTDDHTDVWEVNDDNVIIRDIAAEFMDEGRSLPPELRVAIAKTVGKEENEEFECERAGAGGRGGAAGAAAARVAARAAGAAVAGAEPRAGGAARRAAARAAGGARAAGAAGAPGAVARRAGAARPPRVRLPPARAAVGVRRQRLQQGAGVPGAAVRARRAPVARRLRHGAGAAAPGAREVPHPRREAEVQSSLPGRDDPDDDLLVSRARPPQSALLIRDVRRCYGDTELTLVY